VVVASLEDLADPLHRVSRGGLAGVAPLGLRAPSRYPLTQLGCPGISRMKALERRNQRWRMLQSSA
jgi:hypothetical protein